MKLNIQRSLLYSYVPFKGGLKIMSFFEDMDETDIKFNVNSKRRKSKFLSSDKNLLNINTLNETLKKQKKLNFYNEFFIKNE
jgi:hypothetical protein